MKSVLKQIGKEIINLIGTDNSFNIFNKSYSVFQKVSPSTKNFMHYDIDGNKQIIFEKLTEHLPIIFKNSKNSYQVIETYNGYHILINLKQINKEDSKHWYNNMKKHFTFDRCGNNFGLPIVGTFQGGFTPKMIKI